jgi:2-aminomuconate deaminase
MESHHLLLLNVARPRANYPHARRVGNLIFVSGLSARQPDDSIAGVSHTSDGRIIRDIAQQTEAVIENLRRVLQAVGADLKDVVDVTVFLVDMADYAAFNAVYNRYFTVEAGPARTTVAVRELPHPDLLIEIKATAYLSAR